MPHAFHAGNIVVWRNPEQVKDYPRGQMEVVTVVPHKDSVTDTDSGQRLTVRTCCCGHMLHDKQGVEVVFNAELFKHLK